MKALALIFLFSIPLPLLAQNLTVEVIEAKEGRSTLLLNNPGSPGQQQTNCVGNSNANVYGSAVNGSSTTNRTTRTTGAVAPSTTAVPQMRVDALIRMPDGNIVKAHCHHPPVWSDCIN